MVLYMPDLTAAKTCRLPSWTLGWLTTSMWFGLRPALCASKFVPDETASPQHDPHTMHLPVILQGDPLAG